VWDGGRGRAARVSCQGSALVFDPVGSRPCTSFASLTTALDSSHRERPNPPDDGSNMESSSPATTSTTPGGRRTRRLAS